MENLTDLENELLDAMQETIDKIDEIGIFVRAEKSRQLLHKYRNYSISNVVNFSGVTSLDLDAERVIEAAKGQLKGVVIVGYDQEGEEYFASSYADGGTVLWLVERMKIKLLADE